MVLCGNSATQRNATIAPPARIARKASRANPRAKLAGEDDLTGRALVGEWVPIGTSVVQMNNRTGIIIRMGISVVNNTYIVRRSCRKRENKKAVKGCLGSR